MLQVQWVCKFMCLVYCIPFIVIFSKTALKQKLKKADLFLRNNTFFSFFYFKSFLLIIVTLYCMVLYASCLCNISCNYGFQLKGSLFERCCNALVFGEPPASLCSYVESHLKETCSAVCVDVEPEKALISTG